MDAGDNNFVGPIASSTKLRLLEIKSGQWRGGVWKNPSTGVHWLVVAGLAKGGHEDRDDFYKCIERENEQGDLQRWLPVSMDERLLARETAARLVTTWELMVQAEILGALRPISTAGSAGFTIPHPVADRGPLATLTLTVTRVREPGYAADELELEVAPIAAYRMSNLMWQLTTRALIALHPPEQGWDRYRDTFTNLGEAGAWTVRVAELETAVADGELLMSEPGRHSHYTHRQHLAGKTIAGRAVRGLCGVFFVPTQDHEAFPVCAGCAARLAELPSNPAHAAGPSR